MATDYRDHRAEPREALSRDVFLSKLFTRAATVVFLAISTAVAAIALGYGTFLNR
jgi:hypothetical protein